MTGKERIERTLRREPVDRVPISAYELNPWKIHSWYMQQPSYRNLMALVREHADCFYMWGCGPCNKQEWASDTQTWEQSGSSFRKSVLHTPKGDLTSLYRTDADLCTTWDLENPIKNPEDIDRYLSLPWEYGGCDMHSYQVAREQTGDAGIVVCDFADPLCHVASLAGQENLLILVVTEKAKVCKLMDAILERSLIHLEDMLRQGAGPLWRICGAEYATPPMMGKELFRELVFDYTLPIIDLMHRYGSKAQLHSHGRVSEVLDLIVEMGADATDPLEPPPQGDVDLAQVKKTWGDKLVLFGNMELSWLEYCTRDEIDAHVRKMMESAKDGGGYVLMPTSAPINVPLWKQTEDNYKQYFESALKYGRY